MPRIIEHSDHDYVSYPQHLETVSGFIFHTNDVCCLIHFKDTLMLSR